MEHWLHYHTFRTPPQFAPTALGRRTLRAYRRNTARHTAKASWYRQYHYERLRLSWLAPYSPMSRATR